MLNRFSATNQHEYIFLKKSVNQYRIITILERAIAINYAGDLKMLIT